MKILSDREITTINLTKKCPDCGYGRLADLEVSGKSVTAKCDNPRCAQKFSLRMDDKGVWIGWRESAPTLTPSIHSSNNPPIQFRRRNPPG